MVAEEAGVSVTIVSYVINNNRYVDKEKRRRVADAIKRLGYRPNAIARSLKLKQSKHILFVADRIDNEHFGKLLFEIDRILYDKGYFISLAHNRNNDDFIQHAISRQFDGVVISSISIKDKYIDALAAAGIPVVLIMNREFSHCPDSVVMVDPGLYQGARKCVRYLYDTGCRNIVYVDRFSKNGHFSDMSDLRLKGYVDEMRVLGLEADGERIITGCENEKAVFRKVAAYCNSGAPVDAVFARNDRLAAIVMAALKSGGYAIPDDVSVIGFDNSTLSRHMHPPLTTMEIDRKRVAQVLVEGLNSLLKNTPFVPERLDTVLVVRDSTRAVC